VSASVPPCQRLRLVYTKEPPLHFLSHLDLMRLWARVFRRAGLPLAYTAGFTPRPRFVLAAALAVGFSGRAELLDVFFTRVLDPLLVAKAIVPQLPAGLHLREVKEVPLSGPSLPSLVQAAEYRVTFRVPIDIRALEKAVNQLLAARQISHQRWIKGHEQEYDLRPLIHALHLEVGPPPELWMQLAASSGATGRPDAVLQVLGFANPADYIVVREKVILR